MADMVNSYPGGHLSLPRSLNCPASRLKLEMRREELTMAPDVIKALSLLKVECLYYLYRMHF